MHTQAILIQKTTFTAPAPFNEGHVMSGLEAKALNQLLAENLRNNFAARMKAAAEAEPPKVLTQDNFDDYAETYQLGVRGTRGRIGAQVDPVDVEERRLATAAIKEAIKAKGIKVASVPKETLEAYVERAVAGGKFREQAEAIVEAKSSVTGLEDLDLDL